jgi:succinyl-diaminopimelate desuccinylase
MDFISVAQQHEERMVRFLKKLLSFPSVLDRYDPHASAPFGHAIDDALMWFIKQGQDAGFVTKNINHYAAHLEMGEGDELLGILGHLDVVPPGDGWSHDPFVPIVKDGKIYARGAMDDKGPTVAAYMAMVLLKEMGVTFHKRVRLILGTDEESGMRCIHEYLKTEEMPTLGFAPDATFPLIYGEKGIYSFDVTGTYHRGELVEFYSGERYNVVPDYAECILSIDLKEAFESYCKYHGYEGEVKGQKYSIVGKNAHAMTPHLGINAAFLLAVFLNDHIDHPYIKFIVEKLAFDAYAEKLDLSTYDEETKHFTLNAGLFRYQPDDVFIGLNARYPKTYAFTEGEEKIKKQAKKYGLSYRFKHNMPLHYVDPTDPLVTELMGAYQTVTGDKESLPMTIGGGTYARTLKKAVAFGMMFPHRADVAHQADEHVFIEDLVLSTAIYMEAIYRLTRS